VKALLARLPRPRRPRISWRPSADLFADVALIAGLASVAVGCGWIFPPTAPIVGGGFLAAVAWMAGRPEPQTPDVDAGKVERWYSTDSVHPADEDD
jgi:hypothetical protein